MDEALEDLAALDRLRRLVAGLRSERMAESTGRVAGFLGLAERRLASREAALSADGLPQRSRNRSCLATMMITPFGYRMATTEPLSDDANGARPRPSILFQTMCWNC